MGRPSASTSTECSSSSRIRTRSRLSRFQWPSAATPKINGHPSPTRSLSEPVKLAVMKWTWPDQAMTASTANSGSACIQARMASAIPWDTRNCAHSAPHAIRKAEKTTAGNGQALAHGLPGRAGIDPPRDASFARMPRPPRFPVSGAPGTGATVRDTGSLMGRVS